MRSSWLVDPAASNGRLSPIPGWLRRHIPPVDIQLRPEDDEEIQHVAAQARLANQEQALMAVAHSRSRQPSSGIRQSLVVRSPVLPVMQFSTA